VLPTIVAFATGQNARDKAAAMYEARILMALLLVAELKHPFLGVIFFMTLSQAFLRGADMTHPSRSLSGRMSVGVQSDPTES